MMFLKKTSIPFPHYLFVEFVDAVCNGYDYTKRFPEKKVLRNSYPHKWWKGEGAVIWLCRVSDGAPYAIRARLASQAFAPKLLPAAFPRCLPVRDLVRLLIGCYGAETIAVSDWVGNTSVNFTFRGLDALSLKDGLLCIVFRNLTHKSIN